MKSRALVLVGTVMYALAWFVPVVKEQNSRIVPGWEAFLVALWPYDGTGSDPWYAYLHIVASALSNFVVVGVLVVVLVARRSPSGLLRMILIASAVLNTHWFVINADRGDLRLGYYLWASSFFIIAVGLALEARQRRSNTPAI